MTPASGQDLLHYRLLDKIGEGGMGVVWKALDTTLDREVAIKVLPQAFAGETERLARFEREAKLLASLNHANIAAIHGLHQADGLHFLAMELVEGEDLAERLARGPLPVDEALDVTRQVAEALEAAHERGVVHRDLKPANVKRTPDGKIKVLDFGLAKAMSPEPASGSADPEYSPTLTSAGTQAGMILGTAAYMSPEQARGKPVDRQTDVWAFGCLLYELLTGKRAFPGETVTDVLAAILHREPDPDALPPLPAGVGEVLRGCLRKDKRERFRDIGDVGLLLDRRDAGPAGAIVGESGDASRRVARWRTIAAVSTLALLALLAAVLFGPLRPGGPGRSGTHEPVVTGMTQLTDLPGTQMSPSLSADAEQLLFAAEDGGDFDVFLQRVGGEKPINLTADYADDDFQPAFSPDRQQIAFASRREGGGIFVMGATGESPRQVSDAGFDPAWSPDGRMLIYTTERVENPYNRTGAAQLWTVDLETLERTRLDFGAVDGVAPSWSPNNRRIAYWTHTAIVEGQRDIWTVGVDGADPRAVTDDVATDWDPLWSPDGRWLYFISDRGGSPDLWRVPIDEATGRTRGPMQPVTSGSAYVLEASFAANGRSIAINVERRTGRIVAADFDPVGLRPLFPPAAVLTTSNPLIQMDVSQDGAWIAYRTTAPSEALYVMRTDGSQRRKILDDAHRNRGPAWSPNDDWLLFYSNRSGTYDNWAIRPNGTGLRRVTDFRRTVSSNADWSADGRQVIYWGSNSSGAAMMTAELGPGGMDGVSRPLEVIETPVSLHVIALAVAPGGRHIAGSAVDPQGELALAVCDLQTLSCELPTRDGRYFRVRYDVPGWLDARRIAFWEYELRTAVLWDLERREARRLPEVPGPGEIGFGAEGRVLVVNTFPVESDIWMLTLAE